MRSSYFFYRVGSALEGLTPMEKLLALDAVGVMSGRCNAQLSRNGVNRT